MAALTAAWPPDLLAAALSIPVAEPADEVVVCEGRIVSTAGDATVSPEVGIEGFSEQSHLPA